MPTPLIENCRIIDGQRAQQSWRITGCGTAEQALTQARSDAPAAFVGLVLSEIHIQPHGNATWTATAIYERAEAAQGRSLQPFQLARGQSSLTIRSVTGTKTIYTGKFINDKDPDNAPNCGMALGPGDHGVTGAVVYEPEIEIVYATLRDETWLEDKIDDLKQLVGCINSKDVTVTTDAGTWDASAQELLLLDFSVNRRVDYSQPEEPAALVELSVTMRWRPNRSGLKVGDLTLDVKGWDVISILHRQEQIALPGGGSLRLNVPKSAIAFRVYETADFAVVASWLFV